MVERASNLTQLAAQVVAAYVGHNPISPGSIGDLLRSVYVALDGLESPPTPVPEVLKPPVPIKKSITHDYLISLEDGQHYKTLKRHLAIRGLTPDQYRAKWNLPADYPMVAKGYSEVRAEQARSIGLGRKGRTRLRAVRGRKT